MFIKFNKIGLITLFLALGLSTQECSPSMTSFVKGAATQSFGPITYASYGLFTMGQAWMPKEEAVTFVAGMATMGAFQAYGGYKICTMIPKVIETGVQLVGGTIVLGITFLYLNARHKAGSL